MCTRQLRTLREGDIVRNKATGNAYIVTGNYGTHVTAVRTIDITNLDEWEIIAKGAINSVFAPLFRCFRCGVDIAQPHRPHCPLA